jgi:hypothetical protein
MQLIAKHLPYYGLPPRRLKAGDTFEATDKHAKLLIQLGLAAESIPTEFDETELAEPLAPVQKKRTYKRRDLQAEE